VAVPVTSPIGELRELPLRIGVDFNSSIRSERQTHLLESEVWRCWAPGQWIKDGIVATMRTVFEQRSIAPSRCFSIKNAGFRPIDTPCLVIALARALLHLHRRAKSDARMP